MAEGLSRAREWVEGCIASHHPDSLNHEGLERLCQCNMGCRAMLSDLRHVLSMHMLDCLPGCVEGNVNILCP